VIAQGPLRDRVRCGLETGATTNPEQRWLWTSPLTLKEGLSGGGPLDFRMFPRSGAEGSFHNLRHPAKGKEKPAGLSRRVRGLPLVS